MLLVTEKGGVVRFCVHVQPRARQDDIAGEWGEALKVRLTAPPVDDRANDSLRRLLAGRLNVAVAAVRIAAGKHSRTKRIEIHGVAASRVRALAEPPARQSSGTRKIAKRKAAVR